MKKQGKIPYLANDYSCLTIIFFPPLGVDFDCADSFVVVDDAVLIEIILATVVIVVRNVVVIFVVPIEGTTIFW